MFGAPSEPATPAESVAPTTLAGSDKLNICLLGYRSNPWSGGQGVYIKFLSAALADAGHSVDVISGPPYPELDPGIRLIKLPSLNLFEAENHVTALRPRHLLSWTDFLEWFSMLTGGFAEPYTFGRRLQRHFRRHQPSYDIVHDNQSLCYGTLALQRQGIPLVTTIHHPITSDLAIALQNAGSRSERLLIRRWHSFLRMQKKVARQLDHLVTVSEASRNDISHAFDVPRERLHLVPNGIDTQLFKPDPQAKPAPNVIMATASADAPLKGLNYLLKAVAQLRDDGCRVKLLLLGKLKEDGETARLIRHLGIGEQIEPHRELPAEEVAALYQRACLAVVPSVYEGFGLPAAEAMASGVPVIATDGGALPEVVGDAGVIVPARDVDALAKAMKRLLGNPAERAELARQGRARILEQFSWQAAAERMTGLYRQAMTKAMQSEE